MTTFEDQIEKFMGSCGLVYYLRKRLPEFITVEDLIESRYQHLKAVNEYDPMQLHGWKTDEVLRTMSKVNSETAFKHDQECTFVIDKLAVDKNDYWGLKELTETKENFITWDMDRILC